MTKLTLNFGLPISDEAAPVYARRSTFGFTGPGLRRIFVIHFETALMRWLFPVPPHPIINIKSELDQVI